ncbi:Cytochrome P450 monooxygenase rdc4 [Lasiodiplodia theobromae]|uniref:Cytochrome P450 monooxygenase rdc4 n=1 Tax=Lasiodiplodia theobromae TaxID=45133 RepID=A0A5N5D7I2_9PEZI|nr:Cytochrome P450 monooxygenase rdc4 [Lasiodiplodia theobromae]
MEQTGPHEQGALGMLLRGILALYVLHFFGSIIYGAYLGPLSKYPGPKLNAATAIPFWYNTLRGRQTTWIQGLHRRYGAVVRLSPLRLSYIDAQAWKDIYGHRTGGRKATVKDPKFYNKPVNGVNSLVTEPDDDEHGRVRKIFSNAFSHRALIEQEAQIRTYVDLLIAKTRENIANGGSGKEFDLVKLYNFTTFDIMADLTFGEPLHQLESSQYSPWVSAIFGGFKAGDMARITQEYPVLRYVYRTLVPKRLLEMRKQHFQHAVDRVERRLAAPPAGKADIWELVLRDGGKLDADKMHSNAALFMLAGTETTATLLSGLTWYLLRNPEKMKKLVGEIRGAFASEEEMNLVNLQQLKYLDACVQEGLRLYPPVPIGGPRQTPEGGAVICGKWVPGGTTVFVSQYSAYHSPLNFRDPDSLIPERWLDGTGFEKDSKEVLQPFSFGPRNCLGKK